MLSTTGVITSINFASVPARVLANVLAEGIAAMRHFNHVILDDLIVLNLHSVGPNCLVAMDHQAGKQMLQASVARLSDR